LRWLFRPRKWGLWADLEDPDDTLDDTGGRSSPCPVDSMPRRSGETRRIVYRLGRAARILKPGD